MLDWLATYHESIGMTSAAVITTICGYFIFAFVVCLCWGKLVEDFGPIGGIMASAVIVGAIWMMNHALPGPGFGVAHVVERTNDQGEVEQVQKFRAALPDLDAEGKKIQTGLVHQAYGMAGPWIDMAWAAGVGLWVASVWSGANARKSIPSLVAAVIGGALGGILVALVTFG